MFFGRNVELKSLERLKQKKTSSLVCVLGRRRIGKSTLIEEFGKSFKKFISITGLAPEKTSDNQKQLDNFADSLSLQLNRRKEHFTDWTEAFFYLAKISGNSETLILLDEISWMGKYDPLFGAKLKSTWDQYLKKNNKLILVTCGSVSTWIEENILYNTNFEGRVSLTINLKELKLKEISCFWKQQNFHLGSLEKMLLLSVAGGVPKYIEEIVRSQSVEKNIIELCFRESGMFFKEYEHIFSKIFDRRKESLEQIVKICLEKKLSVSAIAKKLNKLPDNHLSNLIHILETSGFLSKDYYFKSDGKVSKLNHLRVKDNYLRFYLKYIEPNKQRIITGGKIIESLFELNNFESILGFQFENLILANREELYPLLDLKNKDIISAAPYAQRAKKPCQIDLLIHTNLDVFFLCEFKCRKTIDSSVVREVKKKMSLLQIPKRSALKPVLIYQGEFSNQAEDEIKNFFYKTVSIDELWG